MNPIIIVLGGAALLLILVGVILSVRGGGAAQVEDRLSRYTTGDVGIVVEDRSITPSGPTLDPIRDRLERAVSGRGFAPAIKRSLIQADLKLRVSEYVMIMAGSVVLFTAIAWFAFGKNVLFAAVGTLAGFVAPRIFVTQKANKRRRDFDNQLSDTLNLWVNALRSGYSVLQAMETIANETAPPVSVEFERVVQEVRLGLTLEQAFDNVLARIQSSDLDLVVTAVNVQREVGGNLAEVLSIISHTIRERIRIKGEIAVLTAQVMISGYIISMLPVAVTLFLRMSNPEYINELFYREPPWVFPGILPCGWLTLGIGIILIFSGFMALRKIADIEI